MKKKLSLERVFSWGVYIFAFTIPFGTRKFLYAFSTKAFSHISASGAGADFSWAFLYGTDIILLFLVGLGLWCAEKRKESIFCGNVLERAGILFLLFATIAVFFAPYASLALLSLVHIALYFLFALVIAWGIRVGILTPRNVFVALAASGFFQAFVAFLQFLFQRSVGLGLLGESFVDQFTKSGAKIAVEGGRVLRAYGTLPHANILASFAVLGVLSFFYLFVTTEKSRGKIYSAVGMFFCIVGLAVSFSRSGWIVMAVTGILAICGALFFLRRRIAVSLGIIFLASVVGVLSIFSWAIFARAHLSFDERPVKDRWLYNIMAVNIIREHPLGVGVGNEVLYGIESGNYARLGFNDYWLWQPTHNLYLFIASELGIFGLVVFLSMLFGTLRSVWKKRTNVEVFFAAMLFLSLLLFGLFDHFSWDLHAGELIFWLALGFLYGVVSKESPHSSMDRV